MVLSLGIREGVDVGKAASAITSSEQRKPKNSSTKVSEGIGTSFSLKKKKILTKRWNDYQLWLWSSLCLPYVLKWPTSSTPTLHLYPKLHSALTLYSDPVYIELKGGTDQENKAFEREIHASSFRSAPDFAHHRKLFGYSDKVTHFFVWEHGDYAHKRE